MWIARDKNNDLGVFINKPSKLCNVNFYNDTWRDIDDLYNKLFIDNTSFTELKWEDDPLEIEIVKKYKNSSSQILWMARSSDGMLMLFAVKPYRDFDDFAEEWSSEDGQSLYLSKVRKDGDLVHLMEDLIPGYENLSWKNEPIKVELIKVLRTSKPSFIKKNLRI